MDCFEVGQVSNGSKEGAVAVLWGAPLGATPLTGRDIGAFPDAGSGRLELASSGGEHLCLEGEERKEKKNPF